MIMSERYRDIIYELIRIDLEALELEALELEGQGEDVEDSEDSQKYIEELEALIDIFDGAKFEIELIRKI